jgi:lysozyme family protein
MKKFLSSLLFSVLLLMPLSGASIQETRWNSAKIRVSEQSSVRWTARQIERGKYRYDIISKKTGVPWWIVGILHNMECGLDFTKHLHNGDSLRKRTWQVPAGRPKTGTPPFTFEFSAQDALIYDKMDKVNWTKLDSTLDSLEGYNGWGYRKYHPTVPTPYLWAGTTVYSSGKYVADGKWSATAVSKQVGCCAIMKDLGIKLSN